MPRAYDQRQLAVDRSPLQQLTPDWANLPKLDPLDPTQLLRSLLELIKTNIGIDLTGIADFMDWLSEQVGLVMTGFGAVWQQLLDGIAAVFNPIGEAISRTVDDVVNAIQGIFDTGKNAALSADHANIGVERLKAQLAGGGFDEFDYPNANVLPSALYAVSYGGPGAGFYGPNGDGFLVWKPSGAQVREVIYRRTDVILGSDNGVVTVVWSTRPKDPIFADSFGYIIGRCSNITNNTHIRAKIDNNTARIQAVVTGSATQIGGSVGLNIRNGDVFELWYGHADHPRRIWLRQNGTTVLTVEDGDPDGTGAVSQLGTGYRSVGIGCYVDNYLVFGQNPAPSLAGWTWAVQTTGAELGS